MDKFFDSLYNKFILRDLLGKVLPGLIFLLGIETVASQGHHWLMRGALHADIVLYFLIYGLAFATGLLVQLLNPVRWAWKLWHLMVWLNNKSENKEKVDSPLLSHLDRLYAFYQKIPKAKDSEVVAKAILNQRERLVVLKDVTGNLGTSLLAFVLVWKYCLASVGFHFIESYSIILWVSVLLLLASLWHTFEQNHWENKEIRKK